MNRLISPLLAGSVALVLTGCSSVRVKLSGDVGVQYRAAYTTQEEGTTTRSGSVPASFRFDGEVVGWFMNATGSGRFRVRVYKGMGLLVDETVEDSARRVLIERKGRGVSYRVE